MLPGTFRSANQLLEDWSALQSQFEEDGYLFFREALDAASVLEVKRDMVEVLAAQGVVKQGESEPVWTGSGLEAIDDEPLYSLPSWQALLESDRTRSLIEMIFGEAVFLYRNTDIRFALPNDAVHLTPPHQDHFFIRKTDAFRTVWIPLMNIDPDGGGLALARQSHKAGLLEHVEHDTAHSYIFRGRKQRGVPFDRVTQEWVTIDYRPGDLLVFHSLMIHCALPNRSPRVRLSLDARYQPEADPRTWQSEQSILELRHYRREVQRLATEEGASEEMFEALLIEMMKRGLDAQPAHVKEILAAAR